MIYTINLVRESRFAEKKEEVRRVRIFGFTAICFGLLGLALFYTALQTVEMQLVLFAEEEKLEKIETAYQKYQSAKMIVNKDDIELLDKLQNNRIFWTKKLAAMAFHLPENYWITQFGYDSEVFKASGFGYISQEQEQLIVLNNYFNHLRADTTYNNDFKKTEFIATQRSDDAGRMRVSFDFLSGKK